MGLVRIHDNYVFVHPRRDATIKNPATGQTVDHFNLQKGIDMCIQQGRKLVTMQQPYYLNQGLEFDTLYPEWEGGRCELRAINNNPWAFISSPKPTNMHEAHVMVERKPIFEKIIFKGQGQTGIDFGPTYGAEFSHIYGEGLDWVINAEFGLQTTIRKSFATNCTNGWRLKEGDWSGATIHNSQSNISRIEDCRWYGDSNGTAFSIEQAYHTIMSGIYVEGVKVGKAVNYDATGSSTVKGLYIDTAGFECVEGGDAFLYARGSAGTLSIKNAKSDYNVPMVDALASPGYFQVKVEGVEWWKEGAKPLFINGGNTSWKVIDCDNQLFGNFSDIQGMFGGRAVREGCGKGVGFDTVCVTPKNR